MIVATVGLSMGALTHNLFTMIVAMAVTTTVAMPAMLRCGLSRIPMRDSERERLESEEMDAKALFPACRGNRLINLGRKVQPPQRHTATERIS